MLKWLLTFACCVGVVGIAMFGPISEPGPAVPIVRAQGTVEYPTPTAVLTPAPPTPGTTSCSGTLPPGTYLNVDVPNLGSECTLDTTQIIQGSVRVADGAKLYLTGTQIGGNIWSTGRVYATNVQVAGNVQLRPNLGIGPSFGVAPCFIVGSVVSGSVLVSGGQGGFRLENTNVGGNLRLADVAEGVSPSFVPAPDRVLNNQIGGHLQSVNRVGIELTGSAVTREVALWRLTGTGHQATNNQIGGQLRVFNDTGFASISGNTVQQNLDFSNNTGGTHAISGNTILGNLRCQNNVPPAAPTGNIVSGQMNCP